MARKDIAMSADEIDAFLGVPRTLYVTTNGPHGAPHIAPMWFLVVDGKIGFRSFSKSQKIVNLRRDPRLTVLVEDGETYAELRGVMITGTATLIDDAELVLDWYAELAGRYAFFGGEPTPDLDPDAVEQAFGRFAAKNTAVIVEPERVVSWDHTKLAGAY